MTGFSRSLISAGSALADGRWPRRRCFQRGRCPLGNERSIGRRPRGANRIDHRRTAESRAVIFGFHDEFPGLRSAAEKVSDRFPDTALARLRQSDLGAARPQAQWWKAAVAEGGGLPRVERRPRASKAGFPRHAPGESAEVEAGSAAASPWHLHRHSATFWVSETFVSAEFASGTGGSSSPSTVNP